MAKDFALEDILVNMVVTLHILKLILECKKESMILLGEINYGKNGMYNKLQHKS
jgi:hypothetical protein